MTGTKAIIKLVIVITLVAFAGLANAEQWNCYKNKYSSEVIVVVTADTKNNTGIVKVAGTSQSASYSVQGFNRRWDFGDPNNYAFVIEPDGDANYYEIMGYGLEVRRMALFCKEVK